MSRRASFGLVVELDAKAIEAVNARLRTLGGEGATRAMRNGFRRWTKVAQKAVEAAAPFGRTSSVETVRGAERPNVHLKFAVATKVKGSFFLTKTLKVVEPLAVPMLEEAIEREVSRG